MQDKQTLVSAAAEAGKEGGKTRLPDPPGKEDEGFSKFFGARTRLKNVLRTIAERG